MRAEREDKHRMGEQENQKRDRQGEGREGKSLLPGYPSPSRGFTMKGFACLQSIRAQCSPSPGDGAAPCFDRSLVLARNPGLHGLCVGRPVPPSVPT